MHVFETCNDPRVYRAFCESLYFQAAFMNYALTVSNLFPFKPIIIEIFNLLHFYIRRTGLFLKIEMCKFVIGYTPNKNRR